MAQTAPTLSVLVVLFRNALPDIWRLCPPIAAAARTACEGGHLSAVRLSFGDCSPYPLLGNTDVAALREMCEKSGIRELTYEFFDENLGSAGGNNRLARTAKTDFLLLLNPDTYVAPMLLSELVKRFRDPLVGAVDAKQLPFEHPKDFDPDTGVTSWASGFCQLVRRDVFELVGGLDSDNFFLYCDDVDLSWRIRLSGRNVLHEPRAVAFHDKRVFLDGRVRPAPTEEYYGLLGRLMLTRKYDRPDLTDETVAHVERAGTASQRRALEEWRAREASGNLPDVLPGAAGVAQFVGGEYARHRF